MGIFLGDYSIHGKRPSVGEELAKHGSHDQKTHGKKGGGKKGGGGGGGGATPKQMKEFKSKAKDKGIEEGKKQLEFQEDFLRKNPKYDLAQARLEGVKAVEGKTPEEVFNTTVSMGTEEVKFSNKLIRNASAGNENSQSDIDKSSYQGQVVQGALEYIETRFGEAASVVASRAMYENGKAIGTIWSDD